MEIIFKTFSPIPIYQGKSLNELDSFMSQINFCKKNLKTADEVKLGAEYISVFLLSPDIRNKLQNKAFGTIEELRCELISLIKSGKGRDTTEITSSLFRCKQSPTETVEEFSRKLTKLEKEYIESHTIEYPEVTEEQRTAVITKLLMNAFKDNVKSEIRTNLSFRQYANFPELMNEAKLIEEDIRRRRRYPDQNRNNYIRYNNSNNNNPNNNYRMGYSRNSGNHRQNYNNQFNYNSNSNSGYNINQNNFNNNNSNNYNNNNNNNNRWRRNADQQIRNNPPQTTNKNIRMLTEEDRQPNSGNDTGVLHDLTEQSNQQNQL